MEKVLSWKSHGKCANKIVMKIEKILEKSWNFFFTSYYESRVRRSDNSVSIELAVGGFRFLF